MNEFNRQSYTYTPLFCEENIWKLIETFYTNKQNTPIATPVDVIFIINRSGSVAIFNQLASKGQQPVIWDYHVILSAFIEQQPVIFDFDSRCAFPASIQSYFSATFPEKYYSGNHRLMDRFQPRLKCIPAEQYLAFFSSDRSHMKDTLPENEFPAYNIIQPADTRTALSFRNCIDNSCTVHGSKLFKPDEYYQHFLQLMSQ
ncbi:MAG TPA: hypothetical protein ENJ08_17435 [Gammaproteobacteria bacterium]|nr:hypothetical protein [Gammaproteobacteria bacterium]